MGERILEKSAVQQNVAIIVKKNNNEIHSNHLIREK